MYQVKLHGRNGKELYHTLFKMIKERLSNIELLRGVLMFMIVCVHIIGNGILNEETPIGIYNSNWLISNAIDSLFYCCVDTFILITGYFGLRPSFKKYASIDISVIIYSFLFLLLFGKLTIYNTLHCLFPTLSKSYWFLTQYFLLNLAAPFINSFLVKTSKAQHLNLILLGSIILVIVPSFLRIKVADERGMDFVNFSLLYVIGRYFSTYKIYINLKNSTLLYILSSVLIFTGTLCLGYWGGGK